MVLQTVIVKETENWPNEAGLTWSRGFGGTAMNEAYTQSCYFLSTLEKVDIWQMPKNCLTLMILVS